MGRGAKIALIIVGCIFVGGFAMCGGAYYWVKSNAGDLKKEGEAAIAEAAAFAKSHNDTACLDEALTRLDACNKNGGVMGTIKCGAMVAMFLDHSLEAAAPTPDFCRGVPEGDGILDIATWSVGACQAKGREGRDDCARLMQSVQRACKKRSGAPAKPATP